MTRIERSGLHLVALGVAIAILGILLRQLGGGDYRTRQHPVHVAGMFVMFVGFCLFLMVRAAERRRLRAAQLAVERGVPPPPVIGGPTLFAVVHWRQVTGRVCIACSLIASSTLITRFVGVLLFQTLGPGVFAWPVFGIIEGLLGFSLFFFSLAGLTHLFLRGLEVYARQDERRRPAPSPVNVEPAPELPSWRKLLSEEGPKEA